MSQLMYLKPGKTSAMKIWLKCIFGVKSAKKNLQPLIEQETQNLFHLALFGKCVIISDKLWLHRKFVHLWDISWFVERPHMHFAIQRMRYRNSYPGQQEVYQKWPLLCTLQMGFNPGMCSFLKGQLKGHGDYSQKGRYALGIISLDPSFNRSLNVWRKQDPMGLYLHSHEKNLKFSVAL